MSARPVRIPRTLSIATAMLVAGALAPLAAAASTPATLYVSAKAKLEPACSVASAKKPFQTIAGALACAATGDTIKVGAGTFAGGFTIPVGVVIDGDGANRTTIASPTSLSSPLVSVAPGLNTTIENIAVNGSEEADGKNNNGGILDSGGSLTLSQVAISRIAGTGEGADAPVTVAPHSGTATLTVLDSTISNGFGTWGGAIYAYGSSPQTPVDVTLANSTISGNVGDAGGVLLRDADLTARDDTIAANIGGEAGGLEVEIGSTATLTDSLIAGNKSSGDECEALGVDNEGGAKVIDGGHNLIGIAGPSDGCGFTNGLNGDLTGTRTNPLNAYLAPLAANGGPTETQALEPKSPAISAGNPADCQAEPINDLDQRGNPRNANTRNTCDIGAYDTAGKDAQKLAVSASATVEPACSVASAKKPFQTIAGALACAATGDTIKVGAGTFAGGFTIPVGVVIDGDGANRTTIASPTSLSSPLVSVAPGLNTTIENIAVNGSEEADGKNNNGGILDSGGSLTLSQVAISRIAGTGEGADAPVTVAPHSGTATLTVLDSTISNGFGTWGGAIYAYGSSPQTPVDVTLANSTISGNVGDAGGVLLRDADLTARDDTIAANIGGEAGGLEVEIGSTATLTDSLIAGNKSSGDECEALGVDNEGGAKVIDGGHNLIGIAGPSDGCGFTNGLNGDLTGTRTNPLNAYLAPLAANGGPTETQALEPKSPAISAGNPADCQAEPINDLDQRGNPRNANTRNTCDIGAYDTAGKG